jgi:hypothetical protein
MIIMVYAFASKYEKSKHISAQEEKKVTTIEVQWRIIPNK